MKLPKTPTNHFSYIRLLILFLCIPMIFILSLTYIFLHNFFETEIKEYELTNQALFSYSLETTLQKCTNTISHLVTSEIFDPFSLDDSPTKVLDLIKTLSNHTALNPDFSDIIVHFYEDDYYYTHSSSIPANLFYDIYTPVHYTVDEFNQIIHNYDTPLFIKSDSSTIYSYYYFIHPLSADGETYGKIIFNLKYDKVPRISTPPYPNHHIEFIDTNHIRQSFTQYIYKSLDLHELNILADKIEAFDTPNTYQFFELGNHYIYMYRSSIPNLVLLNIMPFSDAHHTLNLLTWIVAIVIVFTISLSILNGFYLFEFAKEPLLYLKKRNKELHTQVEATVPIQQNFYLNQLIGGKISDIETFKEQCDSLGLHFDAPYYTAMIIFVPYANFDHTSVDYQTLEYMQNCKIINYYSLEHTYPNFYVFILSTDVPITLQKIDLPQSIFYLGRSYTNILHISKSYIEASTLIDLTFLGINRTHSDNILNQFDDYISRLKSDLYNDEFDKIHTLLLSLTQHVERTKLPLPLCKTVFIEIIIIFYNYFNENPSFDTYPHCELVEFYSYSSYEPLKHAFLTLWSEMLQALST